MADVAKIVGLFPDTVAMFRRNGWTNAMIDYIYAVLGGGLHFTFVTGLYFQHPEIANGKKFPLVFKWKLPAIEDYVDWVRATITSTQSIPLAEYIRQVRAQWDSIGWYPGRVATEDELFAHLSAGQSHVRMASPPFIPFGYGPPPAEILQFFGYTAAADVAYQNTLSNTTVTHPSPHALSGVGGSFSPVEISTPLFPLLRPDMTGSMEPIVIGYFPNLRS